MKMKKRKLKKKIRKQFKNSEKTWMKIKKRKLKKNLSKKCKSIEKI